VLANDVVVINGGSKTGGVFVESQAVVDELSNNFKVEFVNPGNNCVAQGMVKKTTKPVLFFWDSLHEVTGRTTKNNECQIDFKPAEVIRVDTYDWRVCSLGWLTAQKDFIKSGNKFKIGYGNPGSVFAKNLASVNSAFGTNHTGALYTSGIGSLITALQNREIDYAILSPRIASRAKEQGVSCQWTMHNREVDGLPSLFQASKNNNAGLIGMYQTLFVAKNFDEGTKQKVKSQLKDSMEKPGSKLNEIHKGINAANWNRPVSVIESEWELSVKSNMQ
jgi:hypothetical protein